MVTMAECELDHDRRRYDTVVPALYSTMIVCTALIEVEGSTVVQCASYN